MKVNIFVEGNDANFIEHYIKFLFPDIAKDSYRIIPTGGVTKIPEFVNDFKENTEIDKGINLVIFDADDPTKDFGGFEARNAYLAAQKEELGIQFETFLLPDNKTNGDFESLLEQIINPIHKCLFDCFEGYQRCINSRVDGDGNLIYNSPIRKTKIYAFIDSIKKSKGDEERFKKLIKKAPKGDYYLFDNSEIWDLNAEYLLPLKEFLAAFFE